MGFDAKLDLPAFLASGGQNQHSLRAESLVSTCFTGNTEAGAGDMLEESKVGLICYNWAQAVRPTGPPEPSTPREGIKPS